MKRVQTWLGQGLVVGMALAGCAADTDRESQEAEESAAAPPPELAATGIAQTAGEALCTFANSVKSLSTANLSFSGACTPKDPSFQSYYNGSSNNDLTAFIARPFLMNSAYYCALADAHGGKASAVKDTAVGRFGIDSRIVITERNAKTGRVRGQRIGTVYIFGAAAKLEVQNFEWRKLQEQRPAGTVLASPVPESVAEQIGYHSRVNYSGTDWEFGASGEWPVAGLLSLKLSGGLQQRADYAARGNNLVGDNSTLGTNEFSFAWHEQECARLGPDSPACPLANEIAGHNRLCGAAPGHVCTADDFAGVTDHVIPYDGTSGGAAGPFLFRDTLDNWFHFGKPGSGVTEPLLGEPVFQIQNNPSPALSKDQATTYFGVRFDAKYGAGPFEISVGIAPNIGLRDGLSLRSQETIFVNSEFPDSPTVTAALDAQASLWLEVPITVKIPFLDDWTTTIQVLGSELLSGPQKVTEMRYSNFDSGFVDYTTPAQPQGASDPNAALLSCLQGTDTRASEVPDNTSTFMQEVRDRAIAEIHPCHVQLCDDSSGESCEWNASTMKLDCTPTAACRTCTSTVSICNSRNEIITDESGQPATRRRSDASGDTCQLR